MEEGHAFCNCCRLEYWQSGILGGVTIVLINKDNPDMGQSIDIPKSEFGRIKRIMEEL